MTPVRDSPPVAAGIEPPLELPVVAFLVVGLPADLDQAVNMLNGTSAPWHPLPGGAWQAELEVPIGVLWRYWPKRRSAMFLARRPIELPPAVRRAGTAEIDLHSALVALSSAGIWLQEAVVICRDGVWTQPLPGPEVTRLIGEVATATQWSASSEVLGLSGTWGDRRGYAVRGAIH
jgi:hypothetical protein